MKAEEFDILVSEGAHRRISLLKQKRHDYAVNTDALSNFKKVAAILNQLEVDNFSYHAPSGVASVLIAIKQVRDANLKNSGKVPSNESRQDTLDDLHNYFDLKYACEKDDQEKLFNQGEKK